jgi:modulator of FtsH protease HflC
MRILRWLVILLVAAGVLVSQIFFIVDETKQAIVLQFGDPVRIIADPGLATKFPFVQNVVLFEKRVLSSDAPRQEYLTTDKKRLVVDHVTRWQIVDPLRFYQAVGTEAGARARLDDIVFSELREDLAKVDFVEVISLEREFIMERVAASAAEKASEFGITVVDVRIKRADLPTEVEQSVFERMQAERQRESSLFRAEGEEQAAILRAQADRARTVILAEGYAEAQSLRGEGEARAIAIYATALEQDSEFYAFLRRLEAYKIALKEGDTIVLSVDSDFFRYLISGALAPPGLDATAAEEAAVEETGGSP